MAGGAGRATVRSLGEAGEDVEQIVEDVRAGRPVLPDKQLRTRRAAPVQPPVTSDPAGGPTAAQNDVRGPKDM
jgi:hypothetical protein